MVASGASPRRRSPLTLQPHLYQTLWFRCCLGLMLSASGLLVYRSRDPQLLAAATRPSSRSAPASPARSTTPWRRATSASPCSWRCSPASCDLARRQPPTARYHQRAGPLLARRSPQLHLESALARSHRRQRAKHPSAAARRRHRGPPSPRWSRAPSRGPGRLASS